MSDRARLSSYLHVLTTVRARANIAVESSRSLTLMAPCSSSYAIDPVARPYRIRLRPRSIAPVRMSARAASFSCASVAPAKACSILSTPLSPSRPSITDVGNRHHTHLAACCSQAHRHQTCTFRTSTGRPLVDLKAAERNFSWRRLLRSPREGRTASRVRRTAERIASLPELRTLDSRILIHRHDLAGHFDRPAYARCSRASRLFVKRYTVPPHQLNR